MDYQAIQAHIERARIQRSVVLGELIAETIVIGWKATRSAAGRLRTVIEGTSDYLPRSQA
jgi:hypothetical protein